MKDVLTIESKLSQTCDLHRFAPNPRLQRVIDRTHARMAARELSDEELDFVSAAGPIDEAKPPEEPQ